MMKRFLRHFLKHRKGPQVEGPRAIQQELHEKGIGKELQDKVLDSYSEDEQLQIAKKLAEKEAARINHSAHLTIKTKNSKCIAPKRVFI